VLELVALPEGPSPHASAADAAATLTPVPGTAKHKTATAKKTLVPQWAETFAWEGLQPSADATPPPAAVAGSSEAALARCLAGVALRLALFDADFLSAEPLGTLLVPLSDPTGAPGAFLVPSPDDAAAGSLGSGPGAGPGPGPGRRKELPPATEAAPSPPSLARGAPIDLWVSVGGSAGKAKKPATGRVGAKLPPARHDHPL
jgi:hypothetical protein